VAELPPPPEGILLGYFIVSDDVERSRRFYTEVLGGRVLFSGTPTVVALSNTWIVINAGGGPTDDKPTVTLETPRDPDRVSSFLNFRVKDIEAVYAEWSARGAQFLTPPKRHQYETRCYIRDPDGYLIEVGQTTDPQGDWSPLTGHRYRATTLTSCPSGSRPTTRAASWRPRGPADDRATSRTGRSVPPGPAPGTTGRRRNPA
jgi:catechol 2,3-dioxygenase-like lactoylglutathione lyase family enzyme